MPLYAKVAKQLQEARSVLIASHYHPDGDAIGSTLALGMALQNLGKEVFFVNRDPVPYNLRFLPGVERMQTALPRKPVDCVVLVDCAQPKRVSPEFEDWMKTKPYARWICIDHHLLDHPVADLDLIDPKAAATGCVIWNLLKKMKQPQGRDLATLIYCTLVVDTGFFHYSNTTAEVLHLAGDLVSAGADPWFVAQYLNESNPPQRHLLLGRALTTLQISMQGRYATMEVTQQFLRETGASEEMSEEFANYPRGIQGVEVAALFRELPDGRLKVSLRSKNEVDVSKIAKQFGGGGHEHAAGFFMKPPLVQAKQLLAEVLQKKW